VIILGRKENSIKVKPQSIEDLWHLEKVIKVKDFVTATTQRKFVTESGKTDRKKVTLKLEVEKIEFHEPSKSLKILGIIIEGKPEKYVSLKAHHSFEISPKDILSIEKEVWRKYELDRLKEAKKSAQAVKLYVFILDERDAELFAIQEFGIKSLGQVSASGRGKYKQQDVQKEYYAEIFELIKKIETQLVIAGPGFERENLSKFLKDKNFKNFTLASCQNTRKQGVFELIQSGKLDKIMKHSRVLQENKLIEEFVSAVSKAGGKAVYGPKEIKKALEIGNIKKLILIDSLLFDKKSEIEPLLDQAEKVGAEVHLISKENDMSQKIKSFGSIVAILRY